MRRRSPVDRSGGGTRVAIAAVLVLLGSAMAACGAASQAPTGPAVGQLRIGLTEWSIVTPRRLVAPGAVRLDVTNAGATRHDLVVHGRLGTWRTPVLDPGQHAELVVRTAAGEHLDLDCSLPGHRAAGMDTALTVARAAPAARRTPS